MVCVLYQSSLSPATAQEDTISTALFIRKLTSKMRSRLTAKIIDSHDPKVHVFTPGSHQLVTSTKNMYLNYYSQCVTRVGTHTLCGGQRLDLQELVLSFPHRGPDAATRVIRLGSNHLFLPTILPAPLVISFAYLLPHLYATQIRGTNKGSSGLRLLECSASTPKLTAKEFLILEEIMKDSTSQF